MRASANRPPPAAASGLSYADLQTASEDRRKAADAVILRGMLQPSLGSSRSVLGQPGMRRP